MSTNQHDEANYENTLIALFHLLPRLMSGEPNVFDKTNDQS